MKKTKPPADRNEAIVPEPAPPDALPPWRFRRGRTYPRAIAWFGFRSFWGHLWSMAASIIATEDIDSRDWMRPDLPDELMQRMASILGGRVDATTLAEALERDVWIDFIADTGDDVSVSRAVAEMLFAIYEVPSPEDPEARLTLPRGDVLIFGGDTAYPVANELEIHNRVIVPFNQALRTAPDPRPRVLLGIPGNHDWYAGLDGFGRMFRAPMGEVDRASVVMPKERGGPRSGGRDLVEVEWLGEIGRFFRWAEAFRVGRRVVKRPALPLVGYTPVQNATYWALPLAPGLDLWGADRQLYEMDVRQQVFFSSLRDTDEARGLFLCMADPPYAFLAPHAAGQEILKALDVTFKDDGVLALTGDIHHYCRLQFEGGGMQVTAGGGGAFLHPARIARKGYKQPEAEFPGPNASLALALQIPVQLALGRAGLIFHFVLAAAYLPMMYFALRPNSGAAQQAPSPIAAGITGVALAALLMLIGGTRGPAAVRVSAISLLGGALLAAVPYFVMWGAKAITNQNVYAQGALVAPAYVAIVVFGVLVVGFYLMALTLLGLATDQGFGPLAHPGYKHFVRLRARRDGSGVDGWVIGKVDPLRPSSPTVLVDRFFWKNPVRKPV